MNPAVEWLEENWRSRQPVGTHPIFEIKDDMQSRPVGARWAPPGVTIPDWDPHGWHLYPTENTDSHGAERRT